jgi:effector-binding domain-containing protein
VENLLPIGRFSTLSRLTVKALRYYDDHDVLRPALVDPDSGYRYYSLAQMREAGMIRLLRDLDMPLDEVRAVVRAKLPEQAQAYLDRHEKRLSERIQIFQASLAALHELMIAKEVSVEYEVKLKEVAATPLAGVRTTCGPNEIGKVMGEALQTLFHRLGAAGVPVVGPPLAIYYRYDEEGVDMEVAVPVGGPVPEWDGVVADSLPEGLVAMTVHVGSYQTIGKGWEALMEWVQQHGHEALSPCWETYLTDPATEPDSSKYVTELYQPVKG